MNSFVFNNGSSEMNAFPHIVEFGCVKNTSIKFDSFKKTVCDRLFLYYVIDGRFKWVIDDELYVLYPGDLALLLPGQTLGAEKDILELGTICWLKLDYVFRRDHNGNNWIHFTDIEKRAIDDILKFNEKPVFSGFKEGLNVFSTLYNEIVDQNLGFVTRTNQLLQELILLISRNITDDSYSKADFPTTFMRIEEELRKNLSHQWTVDEMAALMSLGVTSFSEKVKKYTGFSPINYLINIRITEAIKLLKRSKNSITDISLDVGFYSSQHFATTFKKLTGYTPSEFRKLYDNDI